MDCDLNEKVAGQTVTIRTFRSRSTILKKLKTVDVQLRAPSHNYGNPAQLKFGYKKIEGKVIPHEGERLIEEAIKDFGADGLTYRQITQRMTALKIPTKNGKVKWHPMMIKRIIDLM